MKEKKTVIVIGAGMSGLGAARQLTSFGHKVIVLEGRDRVGGRCFSDTNICEGASVDLGASIITGLEGNPIAILCRQLRSRLHRLTYQCPIYDPNGVPIHPDIDSKMEEIFNRTLDETARLKNSLPQNLSLGELMNSLLSKKENEYEMPFSHLEKALFYWHAANLEYGCAADLRKVSLHEWDQDDGNEWGGDHCLLWDGYSSLANALSSGLDIRFNSTVDNISYDLQFQDSHLKPSVRIHTKQGEIFEGDVALVTIPLGVLKSGNVTFSPPLPTWKIDSINRLGFGLLNKIALYFPHVFWDESLDYFGHVNDDIENRGEFYMFWNLQRCTDKPILIALLAGNAAYNTEKEADHVIKERVMNSLSKRFDLLGIKVPDPINYKVTHWSSDPFAFGSYSYVAVGASGNDYDNLSKTISLPHPNTNENIPLVFFAGEATIKQHPATVSGAYLSGIRVAGDIERAIVGDIKIDFDVKKIADEWKSERLKRGKSTNLNKRRRSKNKDDEDWNSIKNSNEGRRGRNRSDRLFTRGKTRVKKYTFNESYSFLFTSSFKIPKKVKSESQDSSLGSPTVPIHSVNGNVMSNGNNLPSNDNNGKKNYYDPKIFQQRTMDFTPKIRRLEAITQQPIRKPVFIPVSSTSIMAQQLSNFQETNSDDPELSPSSMPTDKLPSPPVKPQRMKNPWPTSSTPNANSSLVPNSGNGSSSNLSTQVNSLSKQFKDEVGGVVVKYLSQYMQEGKIASKEDFKHLARKLTHACLEKEVKKAEKRNRLMQQKSSLYVPVPPTFSEDTRKKIKKLVTAFFTKLDKPYSHSKGNLNDSSVS